MICLECRQITYQIRFCKLKKFIYTPWREKLFKLKEIVSFVDFFLSWSENEENKNLFDLI